MLTPTCPLTADSAAPPECARRLVLRECMDLREREAEFGVCDTGRYRCRYVAWGQGPALVLIPGLASDARCFTMLMARLRTQFRCISYDLPAGGADGARVTSYRHADLAADLFALLDHLQVRDCILYGSSFGSTIALVALQQDGNRFSRGILQGGFAHRPLAKSEVLAAAFARFLPGRLTHVPLFKAILDRNHRLPFGERDAEVWGPYVEHIGSTSLRAFATRLLMVHRLDLRPTLASIRRPMLLVCGECDPLVGKACEADLLSGLPNVARAELERCGHEPHWTHPEVLAEVVQLFASRTAV